MRVRVRAAVLASQCVHALHVRSIVWWMPPQGLWCRENGCQFVSQRSQRGVHADPVTYAVANTFPNTITHVVVGGLERAKGGQLGVLRGGEWVQRAKRRQHTVHQRWCQRVQTAVR